MCGALRNDVEGWEVIKMHGDRAKRDCVRAGGRVGYCVCDEDVKEGSRSTKGNSG